MKSRRAVIFLHIPKAAGTTLSAVLKRAYRNATVYDLHASRIAEFRALSESTRREIGLLKGHMAFGIHEYLPSESTYITMLRNPVERVISHYYYASRHPNHYLYEQVLRGNMRLEEYVGSGLTHEMDNGQVRLLAGHDDDLPYGDCNSEHLERAKRNLRQSFSVVGLAERFDDSVLLMWQSLQWAHLPYYSKRNVRSGAKPEVSDQTRRFIERANALDMELYAYGKSLFENALAEMPAVERQRTRFRRRMKLAGRCLTLADQARGLWRRL